MSIVYFLLMKYLNNTIKQIHLYWVYRFLVKNVFGLKSTNDKTNKIKIINYNNF